MPEPSNWLVSSSAVILILASLETCCLEFCLLPTFCTMLICSNSSLNLSLYCITNSSISCFV
ncbi:translation machinery-associated protein 16 [Biomphalaria glabrata]